VTHPISADREFYIEIGSVADFGDGNQKSKSALKKEKK